MQVLTIWLCLDHICEKVTYVCAHSNNGGLDGGDVFWLYDNELPSPVLDSCILAFSYECKTDFLPRTTTCLPQPSSSTVPQMN